MYDITYVETIKSSKTLQLHEFMRNGQNHQKTMNCVKDSFFIKLSKTCKENEE